MLTLDKDCCQGWMAHKGKKCYFETDLLAKAAGGDYHIFNYY